MTLYNNQNVMQYLARRPFGTINQVQEHLQSIISDYATHGYSFWAVTDRLTGQLIGRCGLLAQDVDGRAEVEIAYLLGRDWWGQGYATEAAHACLAYGQQTWKLSRVIALIHPANRASIRAAHKLGLSFEKRVTFHGYERECYAKHL